MIFNIITLFIIAYSLLDLKKGFMIYLCFQIIALEDAKFLSIGSLNITIRMFMSLFYLFLIYCKRKSTNNEIFPFGRPFLVFAFSMFATCFTGVAGFTSEFTRMLSNILGQLVIVWEIWKIVETEFDLSFTIKGMSITYFAACLYGLFEYVTKTNPIVNYKSGLVEGGIMLYSQTIEAEGRDYRMISFMEYPIGAGMTFALFSIFVLVANYYYKEKYPKGYRKFSVAIAALCVICVFCQR